MKKLLLSILFLIQLGVYAQNRKLKDNFIVQIREEHGDLNKDRLIDKVVVTMDTIDATVPLRLQVFFAQPGKKFKLIASSTKIIEAQYPANKNGKHNGNQIPDFNIEKGILTIRTEVEGGHAEHKFKFQNGHFNLIYVSIINYDGKNTTTEKNFNLVTGERNEKIQELGSDKFLIKSKNKIIIRPLPQLQNIKPFEKEYF